MLRPRHAVLAAYVGGWLFLPAGGGHQGHVLPDLDKVTIVDLRRPARRRAVRRQPRCSPSARGGSTCRCSAWCVAPFFSSVTTTSAYYDGVRDPRPLDPVGPPLLHRPALLHRLRRRPRAGGRDLRRRAHLRAALLDRDAPQPAAPRLGLRHPPAQLRPDRPRGRLPPDGLHAARPGRRDVDDGGVALRRLALVSGAKKTLFGIPMIVVVPVLVATTDPLQVGRRRRVPLHGHRRRCSS